MPLKPSLPYARFAPKGIPLPLEACRPWQFVEGRDGNGFVYVFETESARVYGPEPRAEAEAGAWEDALRELAQDAAEAAGLV